MATALGASPTAIAAPGALPATVIGVTLSEPELVTNALAPSGVMAMPVGASPTAIVAPAVRAATSIGVTVSAPLLAT